MASRSVPMDGDDVWDDSALVRSWDDALAEYQKYHSIHAGKWSTNDLKPEALEAAQGDTPDAKPETLEAVEVEDAVPYPGASADGPETGAGVESVAARAERQDEAPKSSTATDRQGPGAVAPQVLLASVRDESLKKLLMSWYYAGYYTGLYEGQQQAAPSRDENQQQPH